MSNPPERIVESLGRCFANDGECDAELSADDYVGMRHMDGFEGKVHAFRCPECYETRAVCPVCTGEDGAPGWFRGESTGDMLACHVCNAREAAAQHRSPW